MNCMTPEAIYAYARASMEARQEASSQGATIAWPSLADIRSKGIDLRRIAGAIRRTVPRLSNGIDLRRIAGAMRRSIPRLSNGIDLRRIQGAIRRSISRTPTAKVYDPE